MMDCEEFTGHVTEYLEGTVPFGRKIGMWLHSAMCVHCRRYLQQIRKVADLLSEVDEADHESGCPEELKADLVEKFRETQTE